MSLHLVEISAQVAPGSVAVLICDGGGRHQTGGALQLPDNIVLLPLPPYAPQLNLMETVWQYLPANNLCTTVWDNYDEIVQACVHACVKAWNGFVNDKGGILQIKLQTDGGKLVFNGRTHEPFVELFYKVGSDTDNRVVILTGSGDGFMDAISPKGFDFLPLWVMIRSIVRSRMSLSTSSISRRP
jgi:hypothetical protein